MRRLFTALEERRKAVWGLRRLAALAAFALLLLPGALSAQRVQLSPVTLRPITITRMTTETGSAGEASRQAVAIAARTITVQGIVVDARGLPVPNAGIVVLRELAGGEAVGEAKVDSSAQFLLRHYEPGTYTAELVDAERHVLATSGAFTAGPGQLVQIAPVMTAVAPTGLPSLVASATDGVLNSAMGAGLTAIGAGVPVSPR